jgi:hypothetical protein
MEIHSSNTEQSKNEENLTLWWLIRLLTIQYLSY